MITAFPTTAKKETVPIEIGGITVAVHSPDPFFRQLVEDRYAGFIGKSTNSQFDFDVSCQLPESGPAEDELQVRMEKDEWSLQRSDLRAQWNAKSRVGWIQQDSSPYGVDCVLRVNHTLILARQGGFLVHAASAIRNGKAFLFAGVSGAGKTTISRLAPQDAKLLTDEISYVQRQGNRYFACGTPFTGELGRVGVNQSAPLSALFLLEKGLQNRIEPLNAGEALQRLLRNILFFAADSELVKLVFQSACEFVSLVPVHRLVFAANQQVWDIIG
jgi:hypothetical protein